MADTSYYVHLKYKNYLKHGISYDDSSESFEQATQNIKNQVQQRAKTVSKNGAAKALETQMNTIAQLLFTNPNQSKGDRDSKVIKGLNQILQEISGDPNLSLSMENGFAEVVGGGTASHSVVLDGKNLGHFNGVDTARHSLQRTKKGLQVRESNYKNLQKRLENLKTILTAISIETTKGETNINYLQQLIKNAKSDIRKLSKGKGNLNMITAWNEIFENLNLVYTDNVLANFEEFMADIIANFGNTNGRNAGEKIMEIAKQAFSERKNAGKPITAGGNVDLAITRVSFGEDLEYRANQIGMGGNRTFQDPSTGTVYQYNSNKNKTQQKADFYVTLNDNQLGASFKTTSGTRGKMAYIKLLEGNIPLGQLLQDVPNFMFHYMNIMAYHQGGDPGDKIVQAKEALKKVILYKAINGGRYALEGGQDNGADIFILQDRAVNRYRIYTIPDLISKIETSGAKIPVYYNGNFDTRFKNAKVTANDNSKAYIRAAAYDRTFNVLQQLHSVYITGVNANVPLT